MTSRKVRIAANSKRADDNILNRFRDFLKEPFVDSLLNIPLKPVDTDSDPILEFITFACTLCGLFIIAFIRVLRPIVKGATQNIPKYADIIITNINNKSDQSQLPLYTYSSYKSKVSTLLNALRRFTSEVVQAKIIKCHREEIPLPDWCSNAKTYQIFGNMDYGAVEQPYREIVEFLYQQQNVVGCKVSRYLPSRDFLSAFRELEANFYSDKRTPKDVNIYNYIRIITAYPGRSGQEMCEWMKGCVTIRPIWMRLNIPKGWKNTKEYHGIKPDIKVANDDVFYDSMKVMVDAHPTGSKPSLFLRPLKNWKVFVHTTSSIY